MKRAVTLVLILLTIALLAATAGWSWLAHTEAGARWLLGKAESALADTALEVGTVSGDLSGGVEITAIRYQDAGFRLQADRIEFAVHAALFPPALEIRPLRVAALVIGTGADEATDDEATAASRDAGISGDRALPLEISLREVSIAELRYEAESGEPLYRAGPVELSASAHQALTLDRLIVHMPGGRIDSSGRLQLAPPHQLDWAFEVTGDYGLDAELHGRLQDFSLTATATADDLDLTAEGRVENVLSRPAWDIDIASPALQWPLASPDPDALLKAAEIHFSGTWPVYHLAVNGQLEAAGLSASALRAEGSGEASSFSLSRLELAGPEVAMEASGQLSWGEEFTAEIVSDLQRLEPSAWTSQWPAGQALHGRVEARWGRDRLTVPEFSLALADSPMRAGGQAVIDTVAGVVAGEFSWQDLQWPPGSTTPDLISQQGSLAIEGQPSEWRLQGSLTAGTPELPPGELRLEGSGDRESVQLTILESKILGGQLAGDLAFNWTGTQQWSAELEAEQVDLRPLASRFGAVVDARFEASGQFQPLRIDLDLERLSGIRQGETLQAEGALSLSGDTLQARQLDIRYAGAGLTLDGGLYDPAGLSFETDIPDLGLLGELLGDSSAEGVGGSLSGRGVLSLAPGAPRLTAELSGRDIAFGDIRIASLQLGDLPGEDGPGSRLLLDTVSLANRSVEQVSLSWSGTEPLRQIDASALLNGSKLEVRLEGAVRDWARPLQSGWGGALTDLRLDHEDRFQLQLETAAALSAKIDRLDLEESCFSGSRGARLCVTAGWTEAAGLNVDTQLKAVPLALIELLSESDLEFSQVLSGELSWQRADGGSSRGDARIEISPGVIRVADDNEALLETGPGLFDFSLSGERLQRGNLDLELPGSGQVSLDFSVPDLDEPAKSRIQGSIRMAVGDIGFAAQLLPFFDVTGGSLDIDLELAGTLAKPTYSGTAALRNGRLVHSGSGLELTDIELGGEVTPLDRASLSGTFRAGEGNGQLDLGIDFTDMFSPRLELEIRGRRLTVVDVPDLRMIADPDLSLVWDHGLLQIDGGVTVPFARLSPEYLPAESATESEDVVVVAGDVPQRKTDPFEKGDYRIRGSLTVTLGSDVRVDFELVEASVTGETRFSWQDELLPIANGAYELSGEIQAYGQLLEITRGRIGFPDIPADNPHLNIRAERQIYGNSLIRQAGVMIAGTLQRPLIEPYTVPGTNTQRAQTLLVTGSDFNYEQGVGAVDIGTYVAPRLYISYGIGIFEKGNIISARYDLQNGFGIKATSGEREAGVDLNYTIER